MMFLKFVLLIFFTLNFTSAQEATKLDSITFNLKGHTPAASEIDFTLVYAKDPDGDSPSCFITSIANFKTTIKLTEYSVSCSEVRKYKMHWVWGYLKRDGTCSELEKQFLDKDETYFKEYLKKSKMTCTHNHKIKDGVLIYEGEGFKSRETIEFNFTN